MEKLRIMTCVMFTLYRNILDAHLKKNLKTCIISETKNTCILVYMPVIFDRCIIGRPMGWEDPWRLGGLAVSIIFCDNLAPC